MMVRRGSWHFALAVGVAMLAGCGETASDETAGGAGTEETATAAEAAPPEADAGGLIQGTPDGGLPQWVADIQTGIGELPATFAEDAPRAQQRSVELYISRQEFIELYYGEGGRIGGPAALDIAIVEAERRFHRLMQTLAVPAETDRAEIERLVGELDAQLDTVLQRAESAGVPMQPRPAAEAGATQ